ncbi:MAG: glycoside hydrolase family 20 zincin-like fold domain-containing protein [Planctomycetota bacterium]
MSSILSSAVLSLVALAQSGGPPAPSLDVVPSPRQVQPRFAPFVTMGPLRVVAAEPSLAPLAERLVEQLAKLPDTGAVVGEPPARSGDVVLTLGYLADGVAGHPEGHSVEVFSDHVALSGATEDGVARAAAKLLQLLDRTEVEGEDAWTLPPFRLDDAPTVDWRALEITSACGVDEIRRAVDLAFMAGMNGVVAPRFEGEDEALLAAAKEARVAGVDVVAGSLRNGRFRRADEGSDAGALPVVCTSDDDLVARLDKGGTCVNAYSLDLTTKPHGEARQRRYTWTPRLEEGAERSRVVGVHVRLDESVLGDLEEVIQELPYVAESTWGRHSGTETITIEFRRRALSFAERTWTIVAP